MVPVNCFDKIDYREPRLYNYSKSLDNIIGFDSEAYRTGRTFVFCTSLGDVITPDMLLDTIFTGPYRGANFVVWNLKYESGAILRSLPFKVVKTLQEKHLVEFVHNSHRYRIKYIPHKRLHIKQVKYQGKSVRFWDISPFYGRTKLDTAAKTYLDDHKDDIDPTLFTESYVAEHYDKITAYCVKDARLTCRLAVHWINKFQQTGVPVTSLYSEASISFTYISQKAEIVTPWEYWNNNRKLVRMALESYEGGKFEVKARGSFTGFEYDISSAYPYAIANLVDIRNARVEYCRRYRSDATYGFLRVRITAHNPAVSLPCGTFHKLRVYPMGCYYLTITKQEYDYIVNELPSRKLSIEIIEAAWLIVNRKRYPYRDVMNELYDLKTLWKPRDRLRSNNYKVIMNGFYGKMAQCLPSEDGTYKAGIGWNPLYASIITAETRIAVTRLQNLLREDCLAVHTDSVITTVPIPARFLGKEFGKFELVERGKIILVACGIYEIDGQCALKGFKKNSIKKILQENPGKDKITIVVPNYCYSWIQAMAQNHVLEDINVFSDIPKILTLNCDSKRLWPKSVTSDDLLNSHQISTPLVEQQKIPPYFWK